MKTQNSLPNSCLVVEIAGMPAAGKTTVSRQLHNLAVEGGVNARLIEEAAAKAPMQQWKRDWQFNAWTLCHTIQRLLEVQAEGDCDLCIVDRGMYDILCWIHWFVDNQRIDPETAMALKSFAKIRQWFARTSLVVHLTVTPDEVLRRRATRGRIINADTLEQLEWAYQEGMDSLQESLPSQTSYLRIDTVSRAPGEIATEIADTLREFNASGD